MSAPSMMQGLPEPFETVEDISVACGAVFACHWTDEDTSDPLAKLRSLCERLCALIPAEGGSR